MAESYGELTPLPSNLGNAVAGHTMQPAILDTPLPAKDI